MLYSLDIVADYAGSTGKQDGDELRPVFPVDMIKNFQFFNREIPPVSNVSKRFLIFFETAGIDMKVQVMEQGAIDTAEKAGDFDILLRTGYFTWGDYPHHLKIHTSKNMYSHWANEEYDRLIAEGESALDEAAKNEAYRRAQQLILDQVPAYYTVHEEKVVAARNSVKGYKITAEDPWLNLAGATIEK